MISGLAALEGSDGTYLLTVNSAGVHDLAGNAGTNALSADWTIDTTAPAAPTNLAISPDNGSSSTDGLTNTDAVTITGSLGETALTVDVFDTTANKDLGLASVTWRRFFRGPQPCPRFARPCGHGDRSAGNISSPALFTVDIDVTRPTITSISTVANPTNTAVATVDVTFNKPIDLTTFTSSNLSLRRDGSANLITNAVTVTLVSGSTYQISGLVGLTTAEGGYTLTVTGTDVMDIFGNVGTNDISTYWLMDTTAAHEHHQPVASAVDVDELSCFGHGR